ncbi:glycosyltransferase family 39 protein [Roseateles puraquae]|uniref:Glycosyltransferase RgtA/B/C/D-like domain-containing protein n=1 Tax=Roseateles puraquae TaxID=431059 RepID=A0A254NGN3_9BURK|nr:glycosyltransferase family 39 protein [Roseateles puraquae]MDG0856675.1 hypothetical protein [Roseateles puraquae]OWR04458.1 hypothetical protein CDO81_07675 [Roseateles puraquae]
MDREDRGAANWFAIGVLTLQWVLMLLPSHPWSQADFPINDDWAHQASVAALVQEGRFVIPDWTATNFLGLLIWGAPWGWLLQPSHEVLRCSGLLAGLLGVWACYGLMLEIGLGARLAMLVAACWAAHPLYLSLSASFMTDVPFITASVVAVWAMLRYQRLASVGWLVTALVAASWAMLIRQTGFSLFVAFAVAGALQPGRRQRYVAVSVLVLGLLLLLGYPWLLERLHLLPAMRHAASEQVRESLALPAGQVVLSVLNWIMRLGLYLGLGAALPLILLAARVNWSALTRRKLLVWTVVSLLVLVAGYALGSSSWRMPLLGKDLIETGLGQRMLHGKSATTPLLWRGWLVVTVLTVLASFWVLALIVPALWRLFQQKAWRRPAGYVPVALAIWLMLQVAPVLLLTSVYDRYVLPLQVPVLALLAWAWSSQALTLTATTGPVLRYAGTAIVLGASLWAAALMHDYFAWNRVRWQWLSDLPAQLGVAPDQIQGGFDYLAPLRYHGGVVQPHPDGWFREPTPYALSIGGPLKQEVLDTRPVDTWLPFSPNRLYLNRSAQ